MVSHEFDKVFQKRFLTEHFRVMLPKFLSFIVDDFPR